VSNSQEEGFLQSWKGGCETKRGGRISHRSEEETCSFCLKAFAASFLRVIERNRKEVFRPVSGRQTLMNGKSKRGKEARRRRGGQFCPEKLSPVQKTYPELGGGGEVLLGDSSLRQIEHRFSSGGNLNFRRRGENTSI